MYLNYIEYGCEIVNFQHFSFTPTVFIFFLRFSIILSFFLHYILSLRIRSCQAEAAHNLELGKTGKIHFIFVEKEIKFHYKINLNANDPPTHDIHNLYLKSFKLM